jgi:maltose-binding protein MalE
MASGGGYVYGYDPATGWDTSDVGLDTEGAITSFTELDALVRQGFVRPDADADAVAEFNAGRVPFVVMTAFDVGAQLADSPISFAVSELPAFEEEPAIGLSYATGFMINTHGGNTEAAREFLRYLVRPGPMSDLAAALGAGTAHAESIGQISDITLAAFTLAGINSQPSPPVPGGTAWIAPLVEAGGLIYRQWGGPIQVLRDAAAQVREAVAGQ